MDKLLGYVVVILSFVNFHECAVIRAEGCGLPVDLPNITALSVSTSGNMLDFQVDLVSSAEVRIEADSVRWHASKEHEYMLLPLENGVEGATVRSRISRDSANRFVVSSRLQAPSLDDMSYSLLLKLMLPCTIIHMAIHQPAGEVQLPIETGRVEAMPPPEITNPSGPVEVEYVISTPTEKKSEDPILRGPLKVSDLTKVSVPWQGEWVRADIKTVEKDGRWKEVTRATINPVAETALYEYDTNHEYSGGRVGVSFIFPILVTQGQRAGPAAGFLTCDPRQKLTSEVIGGDITFYQPFGQASCLKFDFFNTKDAAISMRKKSCENGRGRGPGERLTSVFGPQSDFPTNYAEQTYFLAPPQLWQHQNDEVCYELRAVNRFRGELLRFKIKFYRPTMMRAEARRVNDEKVTLTCSGQNGGNHMDIKMYQGNIDDYYNPHNLVDDGMEESKSWTDLMESDLLDPDSPLSGSSSPGSASKTYTLRLTPGHVISMSRNHQSLFCVIKTKQQFILEKFTLTARFGGEVVEI